MQEKTGIKADRPQSYHSIELIASQWRNKLNYSPLEPFDAKHFFEVTLGELTLHTPSGPLQLVEGISDCPEEGFTRWDSDNERLELIISQLAHERLIEGHPRSRFTVAHEFGHAVLHSSEIVRLAGLALSGQAALHRQRLYKRFFDTEWQANAFAAAILMPATGIRALEKRYGEVRPSLITAQYEVSMESAEYRMKVLQKMLQ